MGESENTHTHEKVSAMEAVLLGALGPGVNRPTWTVLKCVLLALGVCLATMFYAALYSSHSVMAFHVFVLVLLSGGLSILLNWFPYWQIGIDVVAVCGPGFKAPSADELGGSILNQRVADVEGAIKEQCEVWKMKGCTIITDGWTDRSRTLLNFLVSSSEENIRN